MSASIKLPCGCEINDHTVFAMCVSHVVELRRVEMLQQKTEQERQRRMQFEIGKMFEDLRS